VARVAGQRPRRQLLVSLTCYEAEAAVYILRAFGDNKTADSLLASHAASDDPDDDHYQQPAEKTDKAIEELIA
jgi:hypothetical protein